MSGTHRDLLFGSKSRCFACKYHRWGLGPIETINSDARHALLLAENHRWGLGPIETCYSCPEVAVLHAETTGGVLDLQRLVILVLKSLFCMHKTTGEGWNPYSLWAKHAVMCAQTHRWGLGPIQTCKSGLKVAVLHEMRAGTIINLSFWCKSLWFDAQNDRLHLWLRYFLFQSKIRCFAC